MNWDLHPLLKVAVTWTALGTVILPLTGWVAGRFVRNAALRHLAWCLVFSGTLLMLLFEMIRAQQADCAPTPASLFELSVGWLWISGTVLLLTRFLLASLRLAALRIESSEFQTSALDVGRLKACAGVRGNVSIRLAHNRTPGVAFTWGFWSPVVHLPKAAIEWTPVRLSAVLLHELGHVRRRDQLTQTVAFIVCAVFWFNPIYWRAARQMESEAEMAADDCAIMAGIRPSLYATELLQFATQVRSHVRLSSFAAPSMAKSFTIEQRIQSIVDPAAARRPLGLRPVMLVNLLVLGALVSASLAAQHLNAPPKQPSCLTQIAP